MDRLISVNKLLEICESIFTKEMIETLKIKIDAQPTAYDIDKVMEELEEERAEILNSNDYESEIINYCLDSFDRAIEIAKRGEK